jgi:hypothetical protein
VWDLQAQVAAPDKAVPPGRIPYRAKSDHLLLHTIQGAAAAEQLRSTGRLRAERRHQTPDFADAYEWMLKQMAKRLTTDGDTAIWLWARTTRRELVNAVCRAEAGDVLLTCLIPRERVLVSHFTAWHYVLNRWLLIARENNETPTGFDARAGQLEEEFRVQLDSAGLWNAPISEWPAALRERIEESWLAIFEVDRLEPPHFWQATVHELRAEDVIRAVKIDGSAEQSSSS